MIIVWTILGLICLSLIGVGIFFLIKKKSSQTNNIEKAKLIQINVGKIENKI